MGSLRILLVALSRVGGHLVMTPQQSLAVMPREALYQMESCERLLMKDHKRLLCDLVSGVRDWDHELEREDAEARFWADWVLLNDHRRRGETKGYSRISHDIVKYLESHAEDDETERTRLMKKTSRAGDGNDTATATALSRMRRDMTHVELHGGDAFLMRTSLRLLEHALAVDEGTITVSKSPWNIHNTVS